MNIDILQGKRDLNFSIFASCKIAGQFKLFDNINKEAKEGNIPLTSSSLFIGMLC